MDENRKELQELYDFKPDVVIMSCGGNDTSTKHPPKKVAETIKEQAREFLNNGVQQVYVYEIAERGRCNPKYDAKLTPKMFNSQRSKINKELKKCGYISVVKSRVRYPSQYDRDLVHYSNPKGHSAFYHNVRRLICKLK